MPILGAHMSIAGGYYRAVDQAAVVGCDCVQLFTKNNNQWRAKPITEDDVARFQESLATTKIRHTLSHASYLINLGSPNDELWNKSIDALVVEVNRATQLGIPFVVFHPGSYTTSSEAEGLSRIAQALDKVQQQVAPDGAQLLLENTAGQGSNLGCTWQQLAAILADVQAPERLGICIDTCHTFAAGYPLGTSEEYHATFAQIDELIGLDRIKTFHLNDSKMPFGSHKDRHEHIGQGEMGTEPFRQLLNDARFADRPMYLETPKGEDVGQDLDRMNLETLRSLID